MSLNTNLEFANEKDRFKIAENIDGKEAEYGLDIISTILRSGYGNVHKFRQIKRMIEEHKINPSEINHIEDKLKTISAYNDLDYYKQRFHDIFTVKTIWFENDNVIIANPYCLFSQIPELWATYGIPKAIDKSLLGKDVLHVYDKEDDNKEIDIIKCSYNHIGVFGIDDLCKYHYMQYNRLIRSSLFENSYIKINNFSSTINIKCMRPTGNNVDIYDLDNYQRVIEVRGYINEHDEANRKRVHYLCV